MRIKTFRHNRQEATEIVDGDVVTGLQSVQARPLVHPRQARKFHRRHRGGECAHAGKGFVDVVHDDILPEKDFAFQAVSRRRPKKASLPVGRDFGHGRGMPYDPDKMRRAIRRIAAEKGLKIGPWSLAAGKSDRTLAAFLNGGSRAPTIETIVALADVAQVHPFELTGIEPPTEGSTALSRAVQAMLRSVMADQGNVNETLESIRALLEEPRALKALPAPSGPRALPKPKSAS